MNYHDKSRMFSTKKPQIRFDCRITASILRSKTRLSSVNSDGSEIHFRTEMLEAAQQSEFILDNRVLDRSIEAVIQRSSRTSVEAVVRFFG